MKILKSKYATLNNVKFISHDFGLGIIVSLCAQKKAMHTGTKVL